LSGKHFPFGSYSLSRFRFDRGFSEVKFFFIVGANGVTHDLPVLAHRRHTSLGGLFCPEFSRPAAFAQVVINRETGPSTRARRRHLGGNSRHRRSGEAYGEAPSTTPPARAIRARAASRNQNSVDFVRAYWERRSINEANGSSDMFLPSSAPKKADSKTWERLRDHPSSTARDREGSAPQLPANRLASSVLAYQLTSTSQSRDLKEIDRAAPGCRGAASVAVETDSTGWQSRDLPRPTKGWHWAIDWWPYALRGEEFVGQRRDYEKCPQRRRAGRRNGKDAHSESAGCLKAYDQLDAAFRKHTIASAIEDPRVPPLHHRPPVLARARREVLQFQVAGGARGPRG